MCVMSMIFDYHQKLPLDYWNLERYTLFKDLLEEVKQYDEKTGQKDCVDPEKAELLERIEERLDIKGQ